MEETMIGVGREQCRKIVYCRSDKKKNYAGLQPPPLVMDYT